MPQQIDANGAIVDAPVPDDSQTMALETVTVRAGFDWTFWGLLALAAWWAFSHKGSRR